MGYALELCMECGEPCDEHSESCPLFDTADALVTEGW
jgi:hypothetical protein